MRGIGNKEKISATQLLFLLFLMENATTYLVIPGYAARYAQQDAWFAHLVPATLFGLMVAWVAAVFLYVSAMGIANTFGLNDYRKLLLLIVVIALIVSTTMYNTYFQLENSILTVAPLYGLVGELLIPALVLLVAVIRGKSEKQQAAKT